MADSKISALPASTTPLAGTEVLPIVQSGATKKVSVANLTDGRDIGALSVTATNDSSISTLTVGLGAGAVATNTVLGNLAFVFNATGARNTGVGYNALQFNTGNDNTGLGYRALFKNTASANTGVGYNAAQANTTGTQVSAFGYNSLAANTTGAEMSAFGFNSLASNTTGAGCSAFGAYALQSNATGNFNTAFGGQALLACDGANNTAIGYGAGNTATTGSNNGFFGYNAQPSAVDVSNEFTYGNASVTKHRFVNGDIVIGTAGKGIDFSADGQAAGMTSELLDDYEEGTWTPVYVAATGTLGAITYENVQGTYVKIGRQVTVTGGFYCSAFDAGTGSGDLRVGGLPFTNSGVFSTAAVSDSRLFTLNNPTSGFVNISATTTTLFYRTTANGAINNLQVSDAATGAGALNLVYFTATYQV
jgi:hypothetical protein